jgi:hypothetical protein
VIETRTKLIRAAKLSEETRPPHTGNGGALRIHGVRPALDGPRPTVPSGARIPQGGCKCVPKLIQLLAAPGRKRGRGQVVRVVVNEGGMAIVGNVQGAVPATEDTTAASPLAIGHEVPGITMDDLIGTQRELVKSLVRTQTRRATPSTSTIP